MTWQLLYDPIFQTVLTGTALIGAVSGGLGCFTYLRRQNLIGDVISHSSLLGIVFAFLIAYWLTGQGNKSLLVLLPGALVSGLFAMWLNRWLVNHLAVREDSALGAMLAIFFGTGLMLLHWVQKSQPPVPNRAGLEGYLFGMAAAMTRHDVRLIMSLAIVTVVVVVLFWKPLKSRTLDPTFASCIGFGHWSIELLFNSLLVIGIVIGIQSIGVVLMVAILVIPPASARQWTGSLEAMVVVAAALGSICAMVGTSISATVSNAPTGPMIVLSNVVVFAISILFAPKRGVLVGALRPKESTGE